MLGAVLCKSRASLVCRELGLPRNGYRILLELDQSPYGDRPIRIAKRLLLRLNEVSIAGNVLETKGYALCTRDAADRRADVLEITSSGFELLRLSEARMREAMTMGLSPSLRADSGSWLHECAAAIADHLHGRFCEAVF